MGVNHACVSVGGDTQRMRRTSFASRLAPSHHASLSGT